jgi:CDP-paratose 2-epimerase
LRVLVTGGAGFVGSRLALAFRRARPDTEVVVIDNLRRRGSELNVATLLAQGVRFQHGDVRSRGDIEEAGGPFDLLIDAAAEPSVHAGVRGSPEFAIQTNLGGTLNLLEHARGRVGCVVFLSTSRVYAMAPLRALRLVERETRFELDELQDVAGVSRRGITERFPTDSARSIYGATKLASELMVQEYAHAYGLRAVINRCGVIAGAGQFGQSEQGVIALWVAAHVLGFPLAYIGFGGQGKQVRDILHPDDLFALIERQLDDIDALDGQVFNVGGGPKFSVSLLELTAMCRAEAGREIAIASVAETSPVDVPLYLSDTSRVEERFGWRPALGPGDIVADIARWLRSNEPELRPVFLPPSRA